jgi:hypothetical protein
MQDVDLDSVLNMRSKMGPAPTDLREASNKFWDLIQAPRPRWLSKKDASELKDQVSWAYDDLKMFNPPTVKIESAYYAMVGFFNRVDDASEFQH